MYEKLRKDVLPNMIKPGMRILLAVSGGPDSVAMTHILWRYVRERLENNVELRISHIDHGARPESTEEARFVARLGKEWGIPVVVHRFSAKAYAQENGKSFQEGAREWRYARWQEDMASFHCERLATAHHLSDQAETVLYRLLRGSGGEGLAGIYPQRGFLLRPLLTVSKEEILAYCREQGLPYVVDESNASPVYDRNKIRLKLLPVLKEQYNNKVEDALAKTAQLLQWDEAYFESLVLDKWALYGKTQDSETILSLEAWSEPDALLSRLIRKAAEESTGNQHGLEFKFVKKIMAEGTKSEWRQDLPGLKIRTKRNGLVFLRAELDCSQEKAIDSWLINLPYEGWQEFPLGEAGLWSSLPKGVDAHVLPLKKEAILSFPEPLVCRNRSAGDVLRVLNVGHKSLKKIFQEKGIEPQRRKSWPLIASGNRVLWIPELCRDDSVIAQKEEDAFYCCMKLREGL